MCNTIQQYGIYDMDSGRWVEDTIGLPYSECLETFVSRFVRHFDTELDMLKFLSENQFDIRPISKDMMNTIEDNDDTN